MRHCKKCGKELQRYQTRYCSRACNMKSQTLIGKMAHQIKQLQMDLAEHEAYFEADERTQSERIQQLISERDAETAIVDAICAMACEDTYDDLSTQAYVQKLRDHVDELADEITMLRSILSELANANPDIRCYVEYREAAHHTLKGIKGGR